jgi:hypothetical protein
VRRTASIGTVSTSQPFVCSALAAPIMTRGVESCAGYLGKSMARSGHRVLMTSVVKS